jgi:ribosomal peptide maturation radical SAM protein 1
MPPTVELADVVLVYPPFASAIAPPLGLATLKAALARIGFSVSLELANIEFANEIGLRPYQQIALGHPAPHDLVGEWVFSRSLSGASAGDYRAYRRMVLDGQHPAHKIARPLESAFLSSIARMKRRTRPFIARTVGRILSRKPTIVGFSTVYQQTSAAVSIATELKKLQPSITIVFGGANCEGEMGIELLEAFQSIDFVVSGEGETAFPDLVRQICETGRYDRPLSNVYGRHTSPTTGFSPPIDLDQLPIPDYSDFKEAVRSLNLTPEQIQIPFETSRGCWWGEKHHCIFCGLNGNSMRYRKKAPARVRDEIEKLEKDFPRANLVASDNIVDISLLSQIASPSRTNPIFFEAKSNLRRKDFEALKKANVREIQLGVESLSTECLRKLKKGVSALQNIQSLKWACEFGITVHWNLLVDVPDVDETEYERQRAIVPAIAHLSPPSCLSYIRVDRFSPLFESSVGRQPFPAYQYVFHRPLESAGRLAYFFTSNDTGKWISEKTCIRLQNTIETRRARWPQALLVRIDISSRDTAIADSRNPAQSRFIPVSPEELSVLNGCEKVTSIPLLQQSTQLDNASLSAALAKLLTAALVIQEGDLLLSVVPNTSDDYPGEGTFAVRHPCPDKEFA